MNSMHGRFPCRLPHHVTQEREEKPRADAFPPDAAPTCAPKGQMSVVNFRGEGIVGLVLFHGPTLKQEMVQAGLFCCFLNR